jgi:glycerophosphoryl diester phosphodiesterase
MEAFELLGKETTLTLHVEMKVPNAEQQVIQIIRESGLIDRVVISSFLPSVLKTIHELDKEVTTAYLFHHDESPIQTAHRLGCSGLHPLFASVTPDLVETSKREAFFVNPWTVNFEEEMRRLIGLGVDGIITDNPPLLIDLLRSEGG